MARAPSDSDADGWGRPVSLHTPAILVELDRILVKERQRLVRLGRSFARAPSDGRIATDEKLFDEQASREEVNRLATLRRNVLRGLIEGTYGVLAHGPVVRRIDPRR